jgi:hypothetical protein
MCVNFQRRFKMSKGRNDLYFFTIFFDLARKTPPFMEGKLH